MRTCLIRSRLTWFTFTPGIFVKRRKVLIWLKNSAKALGNGIDHTVDGLGYSIGVVLILMSLITVYEVICRYVFNAPTLWTLDLGIYLVIWVGYGSLGYLAKHDRHVRVDLLISHFPPYTKAVWEIVNAVLFLFFTVILVYYGAEFAYRSIILAERGWSSWRVTIWWVKAAIPIGCGSFATT